MEARLRRNVRPLHPVSITRFPLRRVSPGAGLLMNPFVHRQRREIFEGLGPKRREFSNGDRVYDSIVATWNITQYRDQDYQLYSGFLELQYYVLGVFFSFVYVFIVSLWLCVSFMYSLLLWYCVMLLCLGISLSLLFYNLCVSVFVYIYMLQCVMLYIYIYTCIICYVFVCMYVYVCLCFVFVQCMALLTTQTTHSLFSSFCSCFFCHSACSVLWCSYVL